MRSRTTRDFRKRLKALPASVRRQAREFLRLFLGDPSHPGLRFKQVHPDPPIYSARVGIAYRAVAAMRGDTTVCSHADYDRLLKSL